MGWYFEENAHFLQVFDLPLNNFQLHGGEGLFFLCFKIQSCDDQTAIASNFKSKLDARFGARGGRDAVKRKIPHVAVLRNMVSFSLNNMHADRVLIVQSCGEYFGDAGGQGGPFGNQDGCDFVDGLDPQGFGQHDRRDLIHAPAIWAFDHA